MQTHIIGHRGAAAYYPENTMASFEAAIGMGVDMIELDVHMSADGEIIVIHDETLERTTNGTGFVHQHTLKQLQALDAGQGERIPALADVLLRAKEAGVIKAGSVPYPMLEEKLATLTHGCGMQDSVLFSSFNHYALLAFKSAWPDAPIAPLYVGAMLDPWEYAQKLGAVAVHPMYAVALLPGWVDGCHAHDIAVNVWTVDEESMMERLMLVGVDGLVTNRPDVGKDASDFITIPLSEASRAHSVQRKSASVRMRFEESSRGLF